MNTADSASPHDIRFEKGVKDCVAYRHITCRRHHLVQLFAECCTMKDLERRIDVKSLKRIMLTAVFLCMFLLCACGEKEESKEAAAPTEAPAPTETPAPTKAPEPTVTPEPTATPAPTATPTPIPEYKEYDYAEGNLTITLPYEAEEPIEQDGQLEFTDPNGKWTMTIEPITAGQISNCILSIESAQKYREEGAKQVKTEETKICGMNAIVFSSNLDESKNGPDQTVIYLGTGEYAAILKYEDHYIGPWDGLQIEVKTTERFDDIYTVMEDELIQTVLNGIKFQEGIQYEEVTSKGITVKMPTRWQGRELDDFFVGGKIHCAYEGLLNIQTISAPDAKAQAESRADGAIKEIDVGDSHYYVACNKQDSHITLHKNLTDRKSLLILVSIPDCSEEELWKFLDREEMKTLLESLEIDQELLENPEKGQKSGTGYEKNNGVKVSGYTGEETDLVLPSSIDGTDMKGVAAVAFKDNTKITSVECPAGMLSIDDSAFEGCTSLKKVILPDSLTWIGPYAFSGCTSLETVVFGNRVMQLQNSAFRNCTALRDVDLSLKNHFLADSVFDGAGVGGYIHIGKGSKIGSCCFNSSGFEEAVFGEECVFEGYGTFSGSKIKKITLGEGITELPSMFASFCENLEQVDMPESLTKIPDDCFDASPKMEKEE